VIHPRCLGPFSRDPFTDIGRTVSECTSPGLDQGKEFHGFAIDEHHILEVQDRGNRFLFQQPAKRLDVFLPDSARYGQHNDIFLSQDPINSAAHCGDVSPIRTEQNHGASIRREQSGDHSQVIEKKTLMAWNERRQYRECR
jgi:hypothetical protein